MMNISDQLIGDLCFFAVIAFFVIAEMLEPDMLPANVVHYLGL